VGEFVRGSAPAGRHIATETAVEGEIVVAQGAERYFSGPFGAFVKNY
jgi:hypothetical protein